MYLGPKIDEALDKKRDKILGYNTPFYITSVLDRVFKKQDIPVTFKFERFNDYYKNEYGIGGIYDSNNDQGFIVLHFSKHKKFYMSKNKWAKFKFLVSQACQHELIHKSQNQFRQGSLDIEPIDLRSLHRDEIEDEQDYLSYMDEIDAYAHDIAMEICKFYPHSDPYHILRTINRRKKIDSYNYYCDVFKNEDWSHIRKLLLKKTYKWLPHVTYTKG